jgi:hypothetical protein
VKEYLLELLGDSGRVDGSVFSVSSSEDGCGSRSSRKRESLVAAEDPSIALGGCCVGILRDEACAAFVGLLKTIRRCCAYESGSGERAVGESVSAVAMMASTRAIDEMLRIIGPSLIPCQCMIVRTRGQARSRV